MVGSEAINAETACSVGQLFIVSLQHQHAVLAHHFPGLNGVPTTRRGNRKPGFEYRRWALLELLHAVNDLEQAFVSLHLAAQRIATSHHFVVSVVNHAVAFGIVSYLCQHAVMLVHLLLQQAVGGNE